MLPILGLQVKNEPQSKGPDGKAVVARAGALKRGLHADTGSTVARPACASSDINAIML